MNILYIVNTTSQDELNLFFSLLKSTEYRNITRHFIFVIKDVEYTIPPNFTYNFEISSGVFFDDIIKLTEKYTYIAPDVIGIVTSIKDAARIINKEFEHLSNFEYKNVGASIAKEDVGYDYGWKLIPSNVYFGNGWYNLERDGDKYFSWSNIKGELYIKSKTVQLYISNHNQQLTNVYIMIDGKVVTWD